MPSEPWMEPGVITTPGNGPVRVAPEYGSFAPGLGA
jgi:hypothetical protein